MALQSNQSPRIPAEQDRRIIVGIDDKFFHPHLFSTRGIHGRAYYEKRKKMLQSQLSEFSIVNLPSHYEEDSEFHKRIQKEMREIETKQTTYRPVLFDAGYCETEKTKLTMELDEICAGMFPFLNEDSTLHLESKPKVDVLEPLPESLPDEIKLIMRDFQTEQLGPPVTPDPQSPAAVFAELLPSIGDLGVERLTSTPQKKYKTRGTATAEDKSTVDALNVSAIVADPPGQQDDASPITKTPNVRRHLLRESFASEVTDNSPSAEGNAAIQPEESKQQFEGRPATTTQSDSSTVQVENTSLPIGCHPQDGTDSFPTPRHYRMENTNCWIYPKGFVKFALNKLDIGNRHTLISVALADYILKHSDDVVFPVDDTLPSFWTKMLNYSIQLGNDVYAKSTRMRRYLTVKEAVALLRVHGVSIEVDEALPVRIKDPRIGNTLFEELAKMCNEPQICTALYIFNHCAYTFVAFPGKGIFFIDSHSYYPYGRAVVIQTPMQTMAEWKQFLHCVKLHTAMDNATFGNFIPVLRLEEL